MTELTIQRGEGWLEIQWPVRVESLANARAHWRGMQKKKLAIKQQIALCVLPHIGALASGRVARCVVTWTRLAPRKLDSDNLQGAFKYHRDSVADAVGVVDGNEAFWSWQYAQERGAYGARVRFEFGGQ